jgi:hypothetical protein
VAKKKKKKSKKKKSWKPLTQLSKV